jgi:hypothetical protein
MEQIKVEKTAAEVAVLVAKSLAEMSRRIEVLRKSSLEYAEKGLRSGEGWWTNMAVEQTFEANLLEDSMDLWLAKNKMTDVYQGKVINYFVNEYEPINNVQEVSND